MATKHRVIPRVSLMKRHNLRSFVINWMDGEKVLGLGSLILFDYWCIWRSLHEGPQTSYYEIPISWAREYSGCFLAFSEAKR